MEICSRKGGNIHDKVTTEILFFIMELLSFRIEEIIAVRNIVRCGNSGLCICKEEIDRRKSSSTARFDIHDFEKVDICHDHFAIGHCRMFVCGNNAKTRESIRDHCRTRNPDWRERSEEHTSELQSLTNLVC